MDVQQDPGFVPPGTAVVTMPKELDHINAGQVGRQLAAAFAGGATTVIADFTPDGVLRLFRDPGTRAGP
jgi:hypothetical protein